MIADGGPNSQCKLVSFNLRSSLLYGSSGIAHFLLFINAKYELAMWITKAVEFGCTSNSGGFSIELLQYNRHTFILHLV